LTISYHDTLSHRTICSWKVEKKEWGSGGEKERRSEGVEERRNEE
jgi:hypothetical protein